MYSESELRGQISLNDIFSSIEKHASILQQLSHVVETPTSAEARAIVQTASRFTPFGFLGQITSQSHWVWSQLCCAFITMQLLRALVIRCIWTRIKQTKLRTPMPEINNEQEMKPTLISETLRLMKIEEETAL
jgi:hypothetical protein